MPDAQHYVKLMIGEIVIKTAVQEAEIEALRAKLAQYEPPATPPAPPPAPEQP